jgi:hypothetical protein
MPRQGLLAGKHEIPNNPIRETTDPCGLFGYDNKKWKTKPAAIVVCPPGLKSGGKLPHSKGAAAKVAAIYRRRPAGNQRAGGSPKEQVMGKPSRL